jgi:hypothetical protein
LEGTLTKGTTGKHQEALGRSRKHWEALGITAKH